MPTIRIFGGRNSLSGKPERVRSLARNILSRKGVEVIQNGYVKQIDTRRIVLENG